MSFPARRPRAATIRPAARLLAVLAISVAACGPGTGTGPTDGGATPAPAASASTGASDGAGDESTIVIREFAFAPSEITVAPGTTVTWTNEEDAFHTATAGTPDQRTDLFDSGELDTGMAFSFTFDDPGTFPYFCDRHEFMRGSVRVAG